MKRSDLWRGIAATVVIVIGFGLVGTIDRQDAERLAPGPVIPDEILDARREAAMARYDAERARGELAAMLEARADENRAAFAEGLREGFRRVRCAAAGVRIDTGTGTLVDQADRDRLTPAEVNALDHLQRLTQIRFRVEQMQRDLAATRERIAR